MGSAAALRVHPPSAMWLPAFPVPGLPHTPAHLLANRLNLGVLLLPELQMDQLSGTIPSGTPKCMPKMEECDYCVPCHGPWRMHILSWEAPAPAPCPGPSWTAAAWVASCRCPACTCTLLQVRSLSQPAGGNDPCRAGLHAGHVSSVHTPVATGCGMYGASLWGATQGLLAAPGMAALQCLQLCCSSLLACK